MDAWKKTLALASTARTLERARASVGHSTEYKLGKGGFDPASPLTSQCDCSGFVAWCIGVPRELPPRSNKWLQTDTFWAGGPPVGDKLFLSVSAADAAPGDLIVYPDSGGSQGHIGIVTTVAGGAVTLVIHCSSSNWKNDGDAIRETPPTPWSSPGKKTRWMRVDYDELRRQFGVQAATAAPAAPAAAPILHTLLANDPALQHVAAGTLVLSPGTGLVSGIGTVQDALGILARSEPAYAVDMGPNHKYRGYFGPKTGAAVRRFQSDAGLTPNGDIDRETLLALSHALAERDFQEDAVETASAAGEIVFTLRRADREWYATPAGGQEFYVGRRVKYQPPGSKLRFGLMNSHYDGPLAKYDPEAPEAVPLGHWRYMIAPTAICETGGRFACVNTYDRAYFTFGLTQFAAHVPDGDFVRWMRRVLRDLPDAAHRYFPDLALNAAGHISRKVGAALRDLETEIDANKVSGLMRYLNPSDTEVEETEVLNAARLIHWCQTDAAMRGIMIAEAATTAKEKLRQQNRARPFAATKHPNPLDAVCIAVTDILHHEGSKFDRVNDILKSEANEEKALAALCNAGVDAGRNKKLADTIKALRDKGKLGQKRFGDLG